MNRLGLSLSMFLTLGSISGVVNQPRPPVQSDFGGGGLQSPIYVNGVSGECFIYVNGTITPINAVNVKSFGAKGDGVTDDTAALQAAITYLVQFQGGTLYLPRGIYQVSAAVNIPNSVSIMGEGQFVTFLRTTSATAAILNITSKGDLEITQLSFTSSVTRTAGFYIDMNDSQVVNVYIGHVSMFSYFGGIRWAGAATLDVDQCQFLNGIAGAGIGIQINAGVDIAIRHSLWSAASQTSAGILVTNSGDITLDDLNIIRAGNCLWINPGNGQVIPSLEATNCFFDSSNNGLVVGGAGTGTFARSKFTACWFGSHALRGAIFNSAGGVTDGITFEACDFYGNTTAGVDFFSGAASQNVSLLGCNIAGNGAGVNVGTNHAKVRIQGCRIGPHGGFGANTTGIFFNGAFDHYNVTNNDVTGNTAAVAIGTPGTNVVFENNDGFATSARGTATVLNGSTSIAVTHGLTVTPAASDIMVTPTTTLTSAAFYWVDTITSTQFTIHTNVNPGANATFAWLVRSLGA